MAERKPSSRSSAGRSADSAGEFQYTDEIGTAFVDGVTFRSKAVQYVVIDGDALVEGDINLGPVELVRERTEMRRQELTGGAVAAGVVIPGSQFRWPNCVVPYQIAANLPNQNRVTDAIAHWQANTSYNFVLRTSANEAQYPDWVEFVTGSGCSSYVGRQGGRQPITLGSGCSTGNCIHEIGHAVGLWHEQSREDRDAFVTIHFANIIPAAVNNFAQHITDGDDVGAYDYGSIMHYPRDAFTSNGQDTIVPTNPNAVIGQRTGLSAGDIAAANSLCPQGPGPLTLPTPPTFTRPTLPTLPTFTRPTLPTFTRPTLPTFTRPTRPTFPTNPTAPTFPTFTRPTLPTFTRPTRPTFPTNPTAPTFTRPPTLTLTPPTFTRPPTLTLTPPTFTRPPTLTLTPPTFTRPPTLTLTPPTFTRPPTLTLTPPTFTRPPTLTLTPPTFTRPPFTLTRPPFTRLPITRVIGPGPGDPYGGGGTYYDPYAATGYEGYGSTGYEGYYDPYAATGYEGYGSTGYEGYYDPYAATGYEGYEGYGSTGYEAYYDPYAATGYEGYEGYYDPYAATGYEGYEGYGSTGYEGYEGYYDPYGYGA